MSGLFVVMLTAVIVLLARYLFKRRLERKRNRLRNEGNQYGRTYDLGDRYLSHSFQTEEIENIYGDTIYEGVDRDERNAVIERRCRDYGIPVSYDGEGNAGYVPSMDDRILFYEQVEDPHVREARENALTGMMGNPDGDDSWTEVF